MFSRYIPFVALVLVCTHCEAAPLSFNGVKLGQKWEAFLKAHPKAKVGSFSLQQKAISKEQELARERRRSDALLVELGNKPISSGMFFFNQQVLREVWLVGKPSGRVYTPNSVKSLRPVIQQLLTELGPPEFQGVMGEDRGRGIMLMWKSPRQCAFAFFQWGAEERRIRPGMTLIMTDAPWRVAKLGFKSSWAWPAIHKPKEEDETRRRELFALMEELRPHSTDHIEELKPAGAIKPVK